MSGTNQDIYQGESGLSSDGTKTQPWNTPVGYLASTTGNISGIYDMSGGAWEFVAGCIEGLPLDSGFTLETLASEMDSGYIDKYNASSTVTSYNNRILGDATGEMGPFFRYYENDGGFYYHSSWYSDLGRFVESSVSWFYRGGGFWYGVLAGQFYFNTVRGLASENGTFRLVLAPAK